MKVSWRYIGLSLAVVLLLGLALVNPALFRTYLVEPAARILWLAGRTLMVVDQEIYWALLILVALIVGLRLVSAGQVAPRRAYRTPPARPEDRLAYWESLLVTANHDPEARLALQRELENLQKLASVGPELEGSGPRAMIQLPPIKPGLSGRLQTVLGAPFWARLTGARPPRLDAGLRKNIEPFLQSIEMKLEMNHEPPTGDPADGNRPVN